MTQVLQILKDELQRAMILCGECNASLQSCVYAALFVHRLFYTVRHQA